MRRAVVALRAAAILAVLAVLLDVGTAENRRRLSERRRIAAAKREYRRIRAKVATEPTTGPEDRRDKRRFLSILKSRLRPPRPIPPHLVLGRADAAEDEHGDEEDTCPCGKPNRDSLSTRIINGKDALDNEFPWIVGMLMRQRQRCAGSIISRTWVLSAGHCIWDLDGDSNRVPFKAHELQIIPGLHDVRRRRKIKPIQVTEVIMHSRYKGRPADGHDASLLKLEKKLEWSRKVKPACLPPDDGNNFVGETVTYAGWGLTIPGVNHSGAKKLQKVEVTVLSRQHCRFMYGMHDIDRSMMCTFEKERDACQGDSGSALMIEPKNEAGNLRPGMLPGRLYLVGVVSWGEGCADVNHPGVVFKINEFLDWISEERVTKSDPPCTPGEKVGRGHRHNRVYWNEY